jgi:hypothetical protein
MSSVLDLVKQFTSGSLSKDEIISKVASPTVYSTQASVSSSRVLLSNLSFQFSEEMEDTMNHETATTPVKEAIRHFDPHSQVSELTEWPCKTDRWSRFYKRQMSLHIKSQLDKAAQQGRKAKASLKACTFSPRSGSERTPSGKVFERLAKVKDYSPYEALKQQRDDAQTDAELAHCTFSPKISPRSREIQRSLSPRSSRPVISQRTEMMSRNECTFQPSVPHLKKSMEKAKEYLSDDAFKRLYELKSNTLHPKQAKVPSPQRSIETPRRQQYPALDRPFFERQALYEIKKKERAGLRSPRVCSPKVNSTSKIMVKGTFAERNAEFVSRLQGRQKAEVPECTFKPQITGKAQALRGRSSDERCHGDAQKRLANIEKLSAVRLRLEHEKTKSCMFLALSYKHVPSSLRVLSHPETYVDRLNEQAAGRDQTRRQVMTERRGKEMEECSFSPRVRKYPIYLKSLA